MQRKSTATDTAAASGTDTPPAVETANVEDMPVQEHTDTAAIDNTAASDTAAADTFGVLAATVALQEIDSAIDTAQAPRLLAALQIERAAAESELNAALAAQARAAERTAAESEARAASAAISDETRRNRMLANMLAAIEAEYAPVQAPPAPQTESTRRAPSARTIERTMAVAATPYAATAAPFIAAFNASDLAHCNIHRAAGTRYAGTVALASTGPGVANVVEYRTVSTAVRLALLDAGYASGGASTVDALWLARRGKRYGVSGTEPNNNFNAAFGAGAFLALYADGKFRLAYANTANVRRVETDNDAWQLFVGVTAGQTTAAASTAPASTPQAPTPPAVAANPYGALTEMVSCVHCGTRNFATADVCRNRQCNKYPRIDESAQA